MKTPKKTDKKITTKKSLPIDKGAEKTADKPTKRFQNDDDDDMDMEMDEIGGGGFDHYNDYDDDDDY
ncbi:hypothetical protein GS399_04530 [Pedobacter sp. HMF7647]|uniref:Uncharacterized protein n=1 Tax=Hufsiella arboris TaxID=2695275 RepID=A0A7K1Y6N3_9SPHI|nr:hypothetical protein [Hufsiella arboris]MXV50227.1 hypothetical protein [Hufsiella arboris]